MGLMNKIKNILFEEEEVEIPVIKKEEPIARQEETSKKVNLSETFPRFEEKEDTIELPKVEPIRETEDLRFDFPSFDEEEFDSIMPRINPVHEKKEQKEEELPKRVETPKVKPYTSKYTEVKSSYDLPREEPKKKFKPSPNISPVYGILDEDYKLEEIVPHRKEEKRIVRRELDVDRVRKKAFGELEEEDYNYKFEEEVKELPKEEIIHEKQQYNELKGKTIDELLEDNSREEIEIPDIASINETKVEKEKTDFKPMPLKQEEKSLEVLDKEYKEQDEMEDTLENDLFNLIDSMYEDRKGE